MKLLIAGSRGIENFDISKYISCEVDTIISGGAKGVDLIAEEFADKHKLSKIILRPKYNLYGKAAPLKRNDLIIDYSDMVIAFWDGKSKGTKYVINNCKRKNKPIKIYLLT